MERSLLAVESGTSEEQARMFFESFFEKYSKLFVYWKNLKNQIFKYFLKTLKKTNWRRKNLIWYFLELDILWLQSVVILCWTGVPGSRWLKYWRVALEKKINPVTNSVLQPSITYHQVASLLSYNKFKLLVAENFKISVWTVTKKN